MTAVWTLFTLWAGLALIAGLLSVWLRVSTALTEIIVGTAAQAIMGTFFGAAVLGSDEGWIKFLAGIGAIMLTFLAGAELDPIVFKKKWKEATALGVVGFVFPFLGCAAAAFFVLGWEPRPSWLAGVALSTTSVAVVYAVMIEYGLNRTEYGKTRARGMLHQRPFHGARARIHLCAVHLAHAGFCGLVRRSLFGAAVGDACVQSCIRQSAVRNGN
jgi:glutathione-regulated potassium-efflux system ancillary protein KefC